MTELPGQAISVNTDAASDGIAILRIPRALFDRMLADLRRPHDFAAERVGFLGVGEDDGEVSETILIAAEYHGIPDDQYVAARDACARIGTTAIRDAISLAITGPRGIFHVHLHDHSGIPSFSNTDLREQPRLVDSLRAVARNRSHGMIVLSSDAANAMVWLPNRSAPVTPVRLSIVGYPMTLLTDDMLVGSELKAKRRAGSTGERLAYSRQSFLGPDSQRRLGAVRVGLLGYGGGGSHVGQQSAHLGVCDFRIADGDRITITNTNRLVGGTVDDVQGQRLKIDIARRVIEGINPAAAIIVHDGPWQERPELFRSCDVLVGCVDTFAARGEIEVLARRYSIPYIDIGMDVNEVTGEPPRMAGQVILSLPGGPCMTCLGFLNGQRLAAEAALYGNAGDRPQVVWPNGALASSAVGVLVDLITGWTRSSSRAIYLSYDGNTGTINPHVRLKYLGLEPCPHYPEQEVGKPAFEKI